MKSRRNSVKAFLQCHNNQIICSKGHRKQNILIIIFVLLYYYICTLFTFILIFQKSIRKLETLILFLKKNGAFFLKIYSFLKSTEIFYLKPQRLQWIFSFPSDKTLIYRTEKEVYTFFAPLSVSFWCCFPFLSQMCSCPSQDECSTTVLLCLLSPYIQHPATGYSWN